MQIRKAPDLITASVLLLAAGLLPACNSNSDEPFGADGNAGFLAPTAEDDLAMTLEETPVSIDVLANDLTNGESIDPDSVQVVQSVVHGILVPVGGGVFTYTPDTDYYNQQASQGELFAPDTFTYTVASVGGSVSDEATVSITVNDVNDGPLAGDDSASTLEDTSVSIDILANDSDLGGNVNVLADGTIDAASVVPDIPANGTAAWDGSLLLYTPDADFDETDVFGYTVTDDDGALTSATITATVTPVNDPPVLGDDFLETEKNLPMVVDPGHWDPTSSDGLLGNDMPGPAPWETDGSDDIDESTFVFDGMLDTPADPNWSGRLELDNGLLLRDWDGGYMYYPDPNNTIGDSLTYTVFDTGDSGALGGALSSTATVTIAVTDRNTPPVCVNDYDPHLVGLVTAEDVTLTTIDVTPLLANDTDMDSPALDPTSFVVVTEPSRGTLTNHEDGTITYVPDPNVYGWDEFTYKVSDTGYDGSDGDGNPMPPAEADEPGTVYVYIDEVNDAPEANDDFYTVGKVSESLAESYTLDPLENDTGGPGEENSGAPDRSTIVIESGVTNGTLSVPRPSIRDRCLHAD